MISNYKWNIGHNTSSSFIWKKSTYNILLYVLGKSFDIFHNIFVLLNLYDLSVRQVITESK